MIFPAAQGRFFLAFRSSSARWPWAWRPDKNVPEARSGATSRAPPTPDHTNRHAPLITVPYQQVFRSYAVAAAIIARRRETSAAIMPQGGSGKQGGNLMSSGNSKKKMSSKPRVSKQQKSRGGGGGGTQDDAADSTGHTVICPSPERRAQFLRAQRAALETERNKKLARRNDSSRGGQVLGSSITTDSSVDVRAARLLFLQQQQQAVSAAASSTTDDDAMRTARAQRKNFEAMHPDDVSMLVLLLLDSVGDRLGSVAAVAQAHSTLCTVLRNAATKGAPPGGDPKYLTLRASNQKLWSGLLSHAELIGVLSAAGFEPVIATGGGGSSSGEGVDLASATADETTEQHQVTQAAAAQQQQQQQQAQAASTYSEIDLALQTRAVETALAEQLDGTEPADPTVVSSLVAKLEELSATQCAVEGGGEGGGEGSGEGGGKGEERVEGVSDSKGSEGSEGSEGSDGEIDIGDQEGEPAYGSSSASFSSSAAYERREFELVWHHASCGASGDRSGAEGAGLEELRAVLAAASAWCYDP